MSREPDKDGVIRYSEWIPGASDSGPDDEPRSYWERLIREERKRKNELSKTSNPGEEDLTRFAGGDQDLGKLKLHQVLANRPLVESVPALIAGLRAQRKAVNRFPGLGQHNDAADAYRHFRWNYDMAQRVGKTAAKAFADSNEVGDDNPIDERAMDLANNRLGRAMAVDPRFKNLSPDQAAELALRNGWLRGLKK